MIGNSEDPVGGPPGYRGGFGGLYSTNAFSSAPLTVCRSGTVTTGGAGDEGTIGGSGGEMGASTDVEELTSVSFEGPDKGDCQMFEGTQESCRKRKIKSRNVN